jgi:hypothetical protein
LPRCARKDIQSKIFTGGGWVKPTTGKNQAPIAIGKTPNISLFLFPVFIKNPFPHVYNKFNPSHLQKNQHFTISSIDLD